MNYSIGEFSRIARITVKALRLYHDRGLLIPDFVDPESGYRYYASDQINEARVIQTLKELGFSLAEIGEILDCYEEDGELVESLKSKRRQLDLRVRQFRKAIEEIEFLMQAGWKSGEIETLGPEEVEEKLVPDMLVAGIRMKARYSEVGESFGRLMRRAGRKSAGPPMCLFYDGEYKAEGADFEALVAVKEPIEGDGLETRQLEGGRVLSYMHRGPYERLSEAYGRLFQVVKEAGAELALPTREIYHKGAGLILKGRPSSYLTEIQFPVLERGSD